MSDKINRQFKKFLNNECSSSEIKQLVNDIKEDKVGSDLPTVEDVLALTPVYYSMNETSANRIADSIISNDLAETRRMSDRRMYIKVAACTVFLLCSTSLFLHFFQGRKITLHTEYGEVRTVELPDGSTVVLNGNSNLSYQRDWDKDEARTVEIEGEAFFSVIHTQNHQPFVVFTNDDFSIEVFGTKFNVMHRRGKAEVVLSEGQVKVNARKDQTVERIAMWPGQAVSYEEKSKELLKDDVIAENESSWKNSKLVLDNSSLAEVIFRIEETYGVKVEVSDPELLSLKLWGTVPCNNLDNLLKGIETLFSLSITKDGETIVMTKSTAN
ncbi:MAG: FecR domain-containing protein [Cyclobacteriaceae bacterium]|nr:FecR domain-containing protein [Cyclobacteriaceae bacterium]